MKRDKSRKQPNTWPVMWHAKLIDPGDGSGDQLIELPDELLDQLDWKVGDTLEFRRHALDELIVSRVLKTDAAAAVENMQKIMKDAKPVGGVDSKTLIKKGRR
jgi:bifunctional DNA-binding transcriptional regulator/antitoxin component of YhaV-PrlF toxin-antitoxin module